VACAAAQAGLWLREMRTVNDWVCLICERVEKGENVE
jgi:hypothetical protein